MLRQTPLIIGLFFLLFFQAVLPTAAAAGVRDFSRLNPTVQITSYQKLFIGDVLPISSGSGTLISGDGLILTNHHVTFNEESQTPLDAFAVCLTFNVKEEPSCDYTARLVADHAEMDLSLLQLNTADVYGKRVSFPLPFLPLPVASDIQERDRVRVVGYPASGGDTITITEGQVSGFEEFNGFRYFKTDTDFDHGSSGGTVLDTNGRFIGVPTYLRSYAENVGYFLDLGEALSWIAARRNDPPANNSVTDQFLRLQLRSISGVREGRRYSHPIYPFFELSLPKEWRLASVFQDSALFVKKNAQDPLALQIELSFYQFPIASNYFEQLYQDLDRFKESFPDYQRRKATLAGLPADRVTYTDFLRRHVDFYLPFGYAMMHLKYSVALDKADIQEKEMQSILSTLRFPRPAMTEPDLPSELVFESPSFRFHSAGDWRIQKHHGPQPEDLIAEGVEENNFDGYFYVLYPRIPKNERGLSSKERMEQAINNRPMGGAFQLITKNDQVVLDGWEGWLLTYEYEGDRYQEIHQRLEVHLPDGERELIFVYDDLADHFKKNIPVMQEILSTFKNDDPRLGDPQKKGVYAFGSLTYPFEDIQYHRFAGPITRLTDKAIWETDGALFDPEARVGRAQALSVIVASRRHLDKTRGAKSKGYPPYSLSRPRSPITLAEALSLLFRIYEAPLWTPASHGTQVPWHKPLMDKGFELGLIPNGLFDPAHLLTKAELAALIDAIYNQAK